MGARRWVLRQLKKPFFGRFMRPWRWPQGVPQEPYERAHVASRTGARLALLVRTAPQRARGVLVLAHPMGLSAKGFWLKHGHADAFAAAGFHVIAFDFNGFGESESTDFDYPGDLLAVGRYASERFPELPVSAVGASFGAMRALEVLAEPDVPFAGIVAEAVAPTLPDFWKAYPVPYVLLQASRVLYPSWERKLRPAAAVARLARPLPILLIHSRTDPFTPPEHGDAIAAAAAPHAAIERLVVDGAEHTHAFRDARERYLESVVGFLERAGRAA